MADSGVIGAAAPLLRVENLAKHFALRGRWGRAARTIRAVDGVSFDIRAGESLGLVGESGSGKSTVGNIIMRLIAASAGKVALDGVDLLAANGAASDDACRKAQMVFQDPFSSLNPMLSAVQNVIEPLRIQKIGTPDERGALAHDLLAQVGLSASFAARRTWQLSGGQRQRVCIARALALKPKLVVLDEPVSALDVSVQAQVLNLLDELKRRNGLAYLFVSHDLSVVYHVCERVAVMYLGRIVEIGPRAAIFDRPLHPYTNALMSAVLDPDPRHRGRRGRIVLKGEQPSAIGEIAGCRFAQRCHHAQSRCFVEEPPLAPATSQADHGVACWFPGTDAEAIGHAR
jgi:oligopeptide/dipeptide ABC transporter ATP-binding protein